LAIKLFPEVRVGDERFRALLPDKFHRVPEPEFVKCHLYDPDLNEDYAYLAAHFSTAIVPARVRRPRDKAIVEGLVKILSRYFRFRFRRSRFTSIAEINRALMVCVERINDQTHRRFGVSRRERFEKIERAALKALPSVEYDGGEWKTAKLHPDCYLVVDGDYYSAPHIHRHKKLRIKLTEHHVEIFLNLERLAIHPRCRQKVGQRIKILEHFPANSIEYAAKGGVGDIDVLIGYTSYEMGLYLLYDTELDEKSYSEQLAYLRANDEFKNELIGLYDDTYKHEPRGVRGMHLLSDVWFVMPSLLFAEHAAARGSNVWMYEFAWENSRSRLRSAHALDLFYWFGKTDIDHGRLLLGEAADENDRELRRGLARRMQDCLIAFARAGSPATTDTPWPAYDIERRTVCTLTDRPVVTNDPRGTTRMWWLSNQRRVW